MWFTLKNKLWTANILKMHGPDHPHECTLCCQELETHNKSGMNCFSSICFSSIGCTDSHWEGVDERVVDSIDRSSAPKSWKESLGGAVPVAREEQYGV
jgi:hypothetical protein